MSEQKIKVAEMFAGVGGFHLGLSRASENYEVVWADQFEPARKNQFAYNIYKHNFPDTNAVNEDISLVNKDLIPDMDMLVGGFPCQDYSVASSSAKGLYGKKGVLWWDIKDVIEAKWPQFIFLENVDRLLTSPGTNSTQPGRDFGMILRTLSDLGYAVTWKMINAADYGFPQRRRRTFIFATRQDTKFNATLANIADNDNKILDFIKHMPPLSNTLKNENVGRLIKVDLNEYESLIDFSDNFQVRRGFRKTGFMVNGKAFMTDFTAEIRETTTLQKVIVPNAEDETLYLTPEKEEKFAILKGGFRTTKISKTGHEYPYGMGGIAFPDSLDRPARTMVTSEHTVSRMSHVVKDPGNGRLRLISPEESEKINTFPAGWTSMEGITPSNRYFTMGNALVVDLVKEIGEEIKKIADEEILNVSFRSNKKVKKVIHN
ncbi:DNA (cytosine-5-)-methyltransferase [Liquorilactobacillus mali]|uniref:DNA (cytosine-5-)-methyltransferase n=1 Tax=Liquorilactobacillus mali TaxID=1618 RepID=UPI0029537A94|nr:DNA (cytosine-5-)-methyltransferase [Liquorilactobacillus mali]MDV7758619.1 DNA (cytosine-5-)-methyltransferase [Liquorilactobacillus mali]